MAEQSALHIIAGKDRLGRCLNRICSSADGELIHRVMVRRPHSRGERLVAGVDALAEKRAVGAAPGSLVGTAFCAECRALHSARIVVVSCQKWGTVIGRVDIQQVKVFERREKIAARRDRRRLDCHYKK
jgi:hypothetical protein